jgi:hypothetical protein
MWAVWWRRVFGG